MNDHPCDGCGATECADVDLCDVKMPDGPPPPVQPHLEMRGDVVERVSPRPKWQDEFDSIYGNGAYDPAVADALGRWTLEQQRSAHPQSGSAAVKELLRSGRSIRDVAMVFGCPVERVVATLLRGDSTVSVPQVLSVEAALRAGGRSYNSVSAALGVTRPFVARLAEALGLQSSAAETHRAGGGFKHSPEMIQQVLGLRADGVAYRAIAEMFGMTKKQVEGICRYHAKDVAA